MILFDIIIVVEKKTSVGADDWLKMVNFKMAIEALFKKFSFILTLNKRNVNLILIIFFFLQNIEKRGTYYKNIKLIK